MNIEIPIYQPRLRGNEKKYVNECLDSNWISSKGEFITKFEQEFASYVGVRYATTVSNGTVALHLALEALGISEGDEVIVPTFTYISSVNSIAYTGAKPVFVDSLESSWQIDPEDVKRKISDKTKAIMIVHLYGHPCEMDELVKISKDNNIYLIEDCAESFGSYYKNEHTGTFGDIATFSFFGNKTITTGEGGMVITKHKHLHNKMMHLKNQGVASYRQYWHDIVGFNYRMTNICAAIGLAQLEQADEFLKQKRDLAKWYSEGLKDLPLRFHNECGDVVHSYWMNSIVLDNSNLRDTLRSYLEEIGIETRPLFYPAHMMPMYNKRFEVHPIAEKLGLSGINLPSWPGLDEQTVKHITHKIRDFFELHE